MASVEGLEGYCKRAKAENKKYVDYIVEQAKNLIFNEFTYGREEDYNV